MFYMSTFVAVMIGLALALGIASGICLKDAYDRYHTKVYKRNKEDKNDY